MPEVCNIASSGVPLRLLEGWSASSPAQEIAQEPKLE